MPRKINRRGQPPGQEVTSGQSGLLPGYLFDKVVSIPDQYLTLGSELPSGLLIGGTGSVGNSGKAAPLDHVHTVSHGNLIGGTLHALATMITPGFMSAEDKYRLDTLWNSPSGGGGGGTSATFIWHESPVGTRNGVNAVFTLAQSPDPASSLTLFRNGLLLRPGSPYDFLLSGNTVTFNSPSIPISPDILRANYQISDVSPAALDHGTLTGLADDDHLQYLTSPRASTWLATKTTTNLTEGSNLYFTNERAQDAVGNILTNSSTISWTYNDGLGTISAAVIAGGVSHASLASLTSGDPHTQYQLRSEKNANSGYAGLTSLGLLSPSRIPAMPLSFLSDVSPGIPLNGYVLTYNASSGQWQSQSPTGGGGGGVTDHGALTGLTDDDHPQYLTSPRANTWLATKTTSNLTEGSGLYYTDERVQDAVGAMVSPSSTIRWSYNDAAGKIQAFISPANISHASLSNLTVGDPHTQYLLESAVSALIFSPGQISPQGSGSGFDADTVDGYQASAFALSGHVHTLAQLTDVSPGTPTNGQVLTYNFSSGQWQSQSPATGGVSDHGSLTGLGDDDHTQYQLRSEKNTTNGYAGLDSSGLLSPSRIPSFSIGNLSDVSPTTPTNNQILAYHSASGQWRNQSPTATEDIISCYIDASPDLIAVGKKAYKLMPYNCSVTGWYVVASTTGTIAWDVKRTSFASYPSTVSIVNGNSPILSSQSKNSYTTISSWSPISAGDVLDFFISSNSDITNSGLFLKIRRTS
jgi:hypothetical protein